MNDIFLYIAIAATFLLAGSVKGVIGMGLPTVSLGLLAATLDLTSAMAILLVPSFVANLWQATSGGNGRAIVVRLWPFLLMATLTIGVGALALIYVNPSYLSILLGMLLIVYSALNLSGVRFSIPPHKEKWLGAALGAINGIMTGMTGSSVVPGVMYLQAIGLPRDMLVQAMGILFTATTVALAVALGKSQILTAELALISAMAVIPAITGMLIGQRVRRLLSEVRFKKVFFVSVFILGLFIIAKTLILFQSTP
jgi:uncharacterized membrane protein YfcA